MKWQFRVVILSSVILIPGLFLLYQGQAQTRWQLVIPNQSLIATHGDPPKSPFKRGTLTPVPPFLRGARGDLICRINFWIWYQRSVADRLPTANPQGKYSAKYQR
jgi:hypothetical protein